MSIWNKWKYESVNQLFDSLTTNIRTVWTIGYSSDRKMTPEMNY